MLTIKQINEVSFRKSSFSGYKPEDVDDFIDEVSESFIALVKENQMLKAKASELSTKNSEMREKLGVLAEKIETYRDEEDGIKNVLLSAQKLGSASIKEAKAKADSIVADANNKADDMVSEAKKKTTAVIDSYQSKILDKQKEFDTIKATVTAFRSSLYDIYRNHLNAIESIPDFSDELKNKDDFTAQKETTTVEPTAELPIATPVQRMTEPQSVSEIDEIDDILSSYDEEEPQNSGDNVETLPKESFDEIDFNAYSDIPDVLKKDKAALYSTLEFGDDVDLRRKKK